VTVVTLMTMLH